MWQWSVPLKESYLLLSHGLFGFCYPGTKLSLYTDQHLFRDLREKEAALQHNNSLDYG